MLDRATGIEPDLQPGSLLFDARLSNRATGLFCRRRGCIFRGSAKARADGEGALEELEHGNLIAALEATGWRVAGETGAAQLLGMKPTTLSSRIKALGIERPR